MLVPSAVEPQRQEKIAVPADMSPAVSTTVPGAPIGTIVTLPVTLPRFCTVTVTLPSFEVVIPPTYLEVTPSQPQLPAPGVVPPDCQVSVIVVRQELAARITSDILARMV